VADFVQPYLAPSTVQPARGALIRTMSGVIKERSTSHEIERFGLVLLLVLSDAGFRIACGCSGGNVQPGYGAAVLCRTCAV
jgi:hypothetical protein